jgi:hypothetical protein
MSQPMVKQMQALNQQAIKGGSILPMLDEQRNGSNGMSMKNLKKAGGKRKTNLGFISSLE